MNQKRRSLLAYTVSSLAALPAMVSAQTWPARPVKIIVPFPPGGTTDIVARLMADRLGPVLGQPVIVENRPGAAGAIGADAVAKAAADGYVIGMATVTTHAINPAVFTKLPYDVLRDLAPITRLVSVPNVLTVSPALKVRTMQEFIALLRSKSPGSHTYGSAGQGSEANLMGELFNQAAKVSLRHIPYRGSGPALQDAIGGQVDAVFDNLPSSLPFIQSGRLQAMAIASPRRFALLPDVPTFAEVGLPEVNDTSWFGMVAPARTSVEIVRRLQGAAAQVLTLPEVREAMARFAGEPVGNRPEEFAAQLTTELDKFRRLAVTAGIKLD